MVIDTYAVCFSAFGATKEEAVNWNDIFDQVLRFAGRSALLLVPRIGHIGTSEGYFVRTAEFRDWKHDLVE